MTLVLASQSPRRSELLSSLGVEFAKFAVDIDETPYSGETPEDYVHRLALEKARAAMLAGNWPSGTWVLGSDTAVVAQGQILGKPESKTHFTQMMNLLSGSTHQVLTSVALVSESRDFVDVVTTDVSFIELAPAHIDAYWATGEPTDKAGGYGIQGYASVFVRQVVGSYSAVVGLPLHETAKILSKAELPIWQGALLLTP